MDNSQTVGYQAININLRESGVMTDQQLPQEQREVMQKDSNEAVSLLDFKTQKVLQETDEQPHQILKVRECDDCSTNQLCQQLFFAAADTVDMQKKADIYEPKRFQATAQDADTLIAHTSLPPLRKSVNNKVAAGGQANIAIRKTMTQQSSLLTQYGNIDETLSNQSIKSGYPEEMMGIIGAPETKKHKTEENEICCGGRFMKHQDLISKSKYRTIFRGYDNESGCEIAWIVYSLENVAETDREKILLILDTVKQLKHSNVLTCIHYMMKEKELVMITELITTGSIREYLKKVILPRLGVIKNWCRKILEGVVYLHSQSFIHGKLTCESIYINSNNGDIKIGDISIRSIPCYNNKYSELSMCKQLNQSEETVKIDVYCFGLSLLEMISSDLPETGALKVLCKILNKGEKKKILESIVDESLRDIISKALEEDPEKRASVQDLLSHKFLQKSENDHNPVQLSNKLAQLIKKYSSRRLPINQTKSNLTQNSSSALDSLTSSQVMQDTFINQSRLKNKLQAQVEQSNANIQLLQQKFDHAEQAKGHLKSLSGSKSKFSHQIAELPKETILPLQLPEEVKNLSIKPVDEPPASNNEASVVQLFQSSLSRVLLMKIKINFVSKAKCLQVSFEYNLDKDTPEGVASEMRKELNLKDRATINSVKDQIQKIVSQVDTTVTSNKNASSPKSAQQNEEVKEVISPRKEVIKKNKHMQERERDIGGEEEAIIIEERGGAQEHHNQTMDELYHHQNANDGDGQIKCNVVSNPNNFHNSMILHDKNNLNDTGPERVRQKEIKKTVNYVCQQIAHHPEEMDEISDSEADNQLDELDSHLDLQNILIDMFPDYQQNYWKDHQNSQIVNQLHKSVHHVQESSVMNDTLDLSHCSHMGGGCTCHLMYQSSTLSAEHSHTAHGQHAAELHTVNSDVGIAATSSGTNAKEGQVNKKVENLNLPFVLEDISIIIGKRGGHKVSSHEETKNDHTSNHDHPYQEYFLESMTSLMLNIDKNHLLCTTLNGQIQQQLPQNANTVVTPRAAASTIGQNMAAVDGFSGHLAQQIMLTHALHQQLHLTSQSLSSDSAIQAQLLKSASNLKKSSQNKRYNNESGNELSNLQVNLQASSSTVQPMISDFGIGQSLKRELSSKDSDIFENTPGYYQMLIGTNSSETRLREAMPTPNFQTPRTSYKQSMDSKQLQSSDSLIAQSMHLINNIPLGIENTSSRTPTTNCPSPKFFFNQSHPQMVNNQEIQVDEFENNLQKQVILPPKFKSSLLNVYPMQLENESLSSPPTIQQKYSSNLPLPPLAKTRSNQSNKRMSHNITMIKPQIISSSTSMKQNSVIIGSGNEQMFENGLYRRQNQAKKVTLEEDINSPARIPIDQSEKCINDEMFTKPMQSQMLQRKFKLMYKNDVLALQAAFRRIFKTTISQQRGHFCKKTETLVKKYQQRCGYEQDGIVNRELWEILMNEAQQTSCNLSHNVDHGKSCHDPQNTLSYMNPNFKSSSFHYHSGDHQANFPTPSSDDLHQTSTFDQQSTLNSINTSSPCHTPFPIVAAEDIKIDTENQEEVVITVDTPSIVSNK